MDHRKLDAALIAALGAGRLPASLPVFVHLVAGATDADRAALTHLGVTAGSIAGTIATASLSPDQVRELSKLPSVRQIRLSMPLRLLGDQ